MKPEINHKQLTFAREYRGYSQTELSTQIQGLSQSNLSKFEKGLGQISDEVFQKIISLLNFPESFFVERISNNAENAHYRKRSCLPKKEILKIECRNKLIGYLIDQMSLSLEFPTFSINSVDVEDGFKPEAIAMFVRRSLGLKDDDPVKDIFNLLERNGIIIVELEGPVEFDGVSFKTDKGYPLIITNSSFSNDRKRFTIAHELGHLIMHTSFLISDYRDKEDEANKFASEFLMPSLAIKNSLYNLKLAYLGDLKRQWLTSMSSIIRRAKDLGCISSDRYKYFNIEMSRNGYKKKEPVNVWIDEPHLFSKAYKMHRQELNYSDEEIAEAFSLPLDIIKYFFNIEHREAKLRVLT